MRVHLCMCEIGLCSLGNRINIQLSLTMALMCYDPLDFIKSICILLQN